jgi:hypothetical protein
MFTSEDWLRKIQNERCFVDVVSYHRTSRFSFQSRIGLLYAYSTIRLILTM